MKIALAQVQPVAGGISENIARHLEMSAQAAEKGANAIVFPELSVTGYEPHLAGELAMQPSDPLLEPFKFAAERLGLAISVGVPLKTADLPQIGLLTFFANRDVQVYSKQKLSPDEYPFFAPGSHDGVLEIEGTKLVPGICYETKFDDRYEKARATGASCFVASVAKPQKDISVAHAHYSDASIRFAVITLFVNAVGPADNFISFGCSSAWNEAGDLIASMTEAEQGLLIVDTDSRTATKVEG